MTSEEQMKFRAVKATVLPTRTSLLSDPEIAKIPIVSKGSPAIENTRPRPISPYYSDMSLEMAEQFNAVLKGDTSSEQAVKTLQTALEKIVETAS